MVIGLGDYGYVDAFRVLHGYLRRDRSWVYPHGKMGYRLDHILVRGWHVEECEYRHDWRERGLSDHAAMWAALSCAAMALRALLALLAVLLLALLPPTAG